MDILGERLFILPYRQPPLRALPGWQGGHPGEEMLSASFPTFASPRWQNVEQQQ